MSAKISARVRAQAVELLRCSADIGGFEGEMVARLFIEPSDAVRRAARAAADALPHDISFDGWRALDLEAAALLEDGWCPGDPVEVRR